LDLLCRHRWGIRPRLATARAEAPDLATLTALPHEAVLVIGDAALHLSTQSVYPVKHDLGEEWKKWTGLPFVFAVWAARRDTPAAAVAVVHRRLLESRAWGLSHLDELAADAARNTGVAEPVCRAYLGDLDYALSYRHLAGLTDFFGRLAQEGMVPDGSLSFISAA